MKNIYNQKIEILNLKSFKDKRGSLNVLDNIQDINFDIRRLFFTYDTESNFYRGDHAHKKNTQFMISINGSVNLELDNGIDKKKSLDLNSNLFGIFVPPLIWTKQINHSKNNILLVLCSEEYHEDDYINNYELFLKMVKSTK